MKLFELDEQFYLPKKYMGKETKNSGLTKNNPRKWTEKEIEWATEVMEEFGFEAVIPFMSSYDIPLTHGLIIFCISVIITLYPAITILKLNPIKAMKR